MSRQTTNYGLTKPDYTDTADIEVVNSNMDIIDGALKVIDTKSNNVMSKNSSAWSSTVAYAVGQYCIYNNSLWKSLVQHSGQTPQEGTYWARVSLDTLGSEINALNKTIYHNIPRLIPKDITSYYIDGTLWNRLNGTNGFELFEDIFVGDYIKMSRPISAYNQNQSLQLTGSQYVTIAGIDTLWGNGDNISMAYHHLVMVPGMGFGGTQHFGRSRMNPTNTTVGGYAGSEMHTITIGAIATSGSTETTATINQQLYAEFGSHLKTTRELLSNSINSTGYNRFGSNTGCSNGYNWVSCQAVLISEIEVYGSIAWSSSGYDTGNANKQLPLFANSKQSINNRSAWYWLKDIASASDFCRCGSNGNADYSSAGNAYSYVRPRFIIAA